MKRVLSGLEHFAGQRACPANIEYLRKNAPLNLVTEPMIATNQKKQFVLLLLNWNSDARGIDEAKRKGYKI
jgi:hypothetical protein